MKAKMLSMLFSIGIYLLVMTMMLVHTEVMYAADDSKTRNNQTGFLVMAADRGFVGNEEIRDAFRLFSNENLATLVFVTDERTRQTLSAGIDALRKQGARRIIVLPFFISAAHPRYALASQLLNREKEKHAITIAAAYGESHFAVEELASRFRAMPQTRDQSLLIAGYGATDDSSAKNMHDDWMRIAEQASQGLDFRAIRALIIPERNPEEDGTLYFKNVKQQLVDTLSAMAPAAAGDEKIHVIPWAYGPRHDSMMSLEARLEHILPDHAMLLNKQTSPQHLAMWMQHEANRNLPLTTSDVGVIVFAHGADFHWNENVRAAVKPLMDRYKIEFAFSMADPVTIERALQRLEQRGAKAAIIVSAYATNRSFRQAIEYLTGLDVNQHKPHSAEARNQDSHQSSKPIPRIITSLPATWVGGFEAHPLFASAALDRALALSKNPSRDTVIIVAHGARNDDDNNAWLEELTTVTDYMRKNGGGAFKAIHAATWREDWPEKRKHWITKVRAMVTEASQQGGKAIVIPARTTATGPEKKFLAGLEFELGEGFAPHPKFTQWVDEQIQLGIKQHTGAISKRK